MHKQFAGFVTLLGRLAIVPLFALAALHHVTDFAGTQAGAKNGFQNIGISLPDWLLVGLTVITCALLVFGSLSLLLGWQAKLGALCLALFLLGVTPTIHAFWVGPADGRGKQQQNFEKNAAIFGGLMFIMAFGAGPLSLDGARAERRK
jgi:putative oxidoreductase